MRKALGLLMFLGIAGCGLLVVLACPVERQAYAEGCSAADPVFIQPDMRDVQALQAARLLFNWLMNGFYALPVFEAPAEPTVSQSVDAK